MSDGSVRYIIEITGSDPLPKMVLRCGLSEYLEAGLKIDSSDKYLS
jgi:hypothetical protein